MESLLGAEPVAGPARWLSRHHLRIVAFHDVPDPTAFGEVLDHLLEHYHPVSGAEVAAAVSKRAPLPERSIWLTFDDGYRDVVENALPILLARDVPATMLVCPGLIERGEPPWWDIVLSASEQGWSFDGLVGAEAVTAMKAISDPLRRQLVDDARRWADGALVSRLSDPVGLTTWLHSGCELGNHSWDHPCLDQASPEEQRAQVRGAHEWLASFGAFANSPPIFAYPNGTWTGTCDDILRQLGYSLGLVFDHRLTNIERQSALSLSRLRLDSYASVSRASATVSGVLPAVGRLRRRRSLDASGEDPA
jgi:peptidoglycan/xylan/chitin deacetylase (PgdA/CDA1 family)